MCRMLLWEFGLCCTPDKRIELGIHMVEGANGYAIGLLPNQHTAHHRDAAATTHSQSVHTTSDQTH